jgi:predicted RNase H-like nuclease
VADRRTSDVNNSIGFAVLRQSMFVIGIDGCSAGWVGFKVDTSSRGTVVELIDLPAVLRSHPSDFACLGIDIPIGLLNAPRACDLAARALLGQPRGSSVFPAPCRAAIQARNYEEAKAINRLKAGRAISLQAWCISPKIRQVDEAITPAHQQWVFEVHPEVSFWALNGKRPMAHRKTTAQGKADRIALMNKVFPGVEQHLSHRAHGIEVDDVLDAAAAAWTALRMHDGIAKCVCAAEQDEKGLAVTIHY